MSERIEQKHICANELVEKQHRVRYPCALRKNLMPFCSFISEIRKRLPMNFEEKHILPRIDKVKNEESRVKKHGTKETQLDTIEHLQ
jgi:hypothetical protein